MGKYIKNYILYKKIKYLYVAVHNLLKNLIYIILFTRENLSGGYHLHFENSSLEVQVSRLYFISPYSQ